MKREQKKKKNFWTAGRTACAVAVFASTALYASTRESSYMENLTANPATRSGRPRSRR